MRRLDATQIRPPPQCNVKIEVSRFLNLILITLVCLDIGVAVKVVGYFVPLAKFFIVGDDFYSIASSAYYLKYSAFMGV